MAGTNPSLGALTFDEGDGPPVGRGDLATLVHNPAGGEPAVVLVKKRAKPFQVSLRGPFSAVPDVAALVGTQVNYVKDGTTLAVVVLEAALQSARGILIPGTTGVRYFVEATFTLAPRAQLAGETFSDLQDRAGVALQDRAGNQLQVRA